MIKHGENLITKNLNVTVDIDIAKTMLRIAGYKVDNLSDNEIFYKVISEVAEPYGLSINNEYDKTSIELLKKEQKSNDKSSWLNQKDYEQVKKEIDSWSQWKRDYYNEYFINRINN